MRNARALRLRFSYPKRFAAFLIVFLLLSTVSSFSAYNPMAAVAADGLTDIPGSLPPLVQRLAPARVPDNVAPQVPLTIVLTPRNEAEFRQQADSSRNQSDFKVLSDSEIINRYSPTQLTFDGIKAYLTKQGLKITYEAADRLVIGVLAPSREIAQAAFYTTTTYGTFGDKSGFVNTQPIRVPTALAPFIKGVAGFNDFAAKTNPIKTKPVEQGIKPNTAPSTSVHSPSSLRKAYNVTGAGFDGTGTTVGITLWAAPIATNYNTWAADFAFPTPNVTVIGSNPGATDGVVQEADLDVQNVLAVAPKAAIRFYVASDGSDGPLQVATSQAINENVDVITNSWGACEQLLGQNLYDSWHTIYSSAALKGIPVLASSGDSGIFECGVNSSDAGKASHPASDNLVNAVGGTNVQLDGSYNWVNETGWTCPNPSQNITCTQANGGSSGGGTSVFAPRPPYQLDGTKRQVPDFSTNGDPASGMYVRLGATSSGYVLGGGTSASSPWMAGVLALATQKKGRKVGNPNPYFYQAAQPVGVGIFDVTSGYNGVNAAAGYDRITGIGSVRDVAKFITTLASDVTGVYHLQNPFRLYDSRISQGGPGPFSPNVARTIPVVGNTGLGGIGTPVPTGATAVMLNITAVSPVGGGYVTAYPTGGSPALGTVLNYFRAGQTVGNYAIVPLRTDGATAGSIDIKVGVNNTDVVLDIAGYINPNLSGALTYRALPSSTTNFRLYDSRSGPGPLTPGNSYDVSVAGALGGAIPANAKAVVINLTVANRVNGGFLTAYGTGQSQPNVASVNWQASSPNAVANLAIVQIGAGGFIRITAGGGAGASAQVIVDAVGYLTDADLSVGRYTTVLAGANRLYDSRIDGGRLDSASRTINVTGSFGIPLTASAVVLHATAVNTTGGGYLALYSGPTYPGNSTLNFEPNNIVGNLAFVSLTNGQIKVDIQAGGGDFVLDVVGYVP